MSTGKHGWWSRKHPLGLRLTVFISAFGVIWLIVEPLGLAPGIMLWTSILVWSFLITVTYELLKKLKAERNSHSLCLQEIEQLKSEIKLAGEGKSYCCVINQYRPVCPVGISAIHEQTETTLRSSLEEAKHSFRWLGLSAFNVVHNNQDVFEEKQQVDYEFVTVSPSNKRLLKKIDEYFMIPAGSLESENLVTSSKDILSKIADKVHNRLTVLHYNQMPSFRIVLLDDTKALVSFYERGKDALKSHQLEITESEDAPYWILKWFQMFYEKVLLTEEMAKSDQ